MASKVMDKSVEEGITLVLFGLSGALLPMEVETGRSRSSSRRAETVSMGCIEAALSSTGCAAFMIDADPRDHADTAGSEGADETDGAPELVVVVVVSMTSFNTSPTPRASPVGNEVGSFVSSLLLLLAQPPPTALVVEAQVVVLVVVVVFLPSFEVTTEEEDSSTTTTCARGCGPPLGAGPVELPLPAPLVVAALGLVVVEVGGADLPRPLPLFA
mmetsp:Transcript_9020/g.11825  ORF Transcript_9020/g.11825 Transcript_9020/m.11825 type:complete len:215 (-) Transcript_9020:374-1018(-)